MEVNMEISAGQAVRIELPRERIPALQNADLELEDVLAVVEFIAYDIGTPGFRDLEAYIALNIGQRKYYVDMWVVKETEDPIAKINELLQDVIDRAPWEETVADMMAEIQEED